MKRISFLFLLLMLNSVSYAEDIQATMSWAGLHKMGFVVTGVVETVNVQPGVKINKGDVLAQLDTRPFMYQVQICQAEIEEIQPRLFDAKTEFDQAQELFERTVLSVIELQKIEGIYKSLKAEESKAKAECKLKQWQADQAVLKTPNAAYVMSSNIYSGMVISDENKSIATIELVSASKASARSFISSKQAQQYRVGDGLKVIVDEQPLAATVESISLHDRTAHQYELTVVFNYAQMVESGKAVTMRFE